MKWKTPQKIESNPNDRDLLRACREGDVDLAHTCIERGAKVDCVDNESGWMPLHTAVTGLHVETVQVLLEADANPDLIAKVNGLTPLGILVRLEKPTTTRPKHVRKRTGHIDQEEKVLIIAEALLRFGADPSGCVDIQSESTPLHLAALQGRLELVKLLLEYGAFTMIHRNEQPSGLKSLGDSKPATAALSQNVQSATPLGISCRAGQVAVMDYLLSALPPQTLESSCVLQEALQEARRHDQVECLVGLWEYSEEVLWLDGHGEGGGVDPVRKAGLAQSFFDIFTSNANTSSHSTQVDQNDEDASTVTSWLNILHEACSRRSVNLLEPLLQRLPDQEEFFEQLRKQRSLSSVRAGLIQAVDPRDHRTLLHRFCTATTAKSASGNQLFGATQDESHSYSSAALEWISRLLQLSREADDIEMEEIRLMAAASAHSRSQERQSGEAQYENDSKFTLETSEIESESNDSDEQHQQHLESDSEDEDDSDSSEESSGSEDDESGSEEESEAGTGEDCTARSESDPLPPVSDLRAAQQVHPHEDSDFEDGDSDEDGSEDDESAEDESSYFIESQTCSESEEDDAGSEMSSDAEAELHNSCAVAVPSHSGKDLVNTGDVNLQTALHLACSAAFIPAIELLLQEENILVNAPDYLGDTPLLVAERTDVIRRLLQDRRTDVNVGNHEGITPLHKATRIGDMVRAQIFLQNGADPQIRDLRGRTALYLACTKGCTGSCAYLLAYGADPNAATSDEDRDTPLHAACRGGHLGVILRLFAADIEAKDANGRTPLHVACCMGQLEIVEYLMTERRANLNAQDENGSTPFEVACHAGRVTVVFYLVRYHTSHLWDRNAAQRVIEKYTLTSKIASMDVYEISLLSHSSRSYREDPFSFSYLYDSSADKTDPCNSCYNNFSSDDEPASYSVSSSYDLEPFVYSSRYRRSLYEAEPFYY